MIFDCLRTCVTGLEMFFNLQRSDRVQFTVRICLQKGAFVFATHAKLLLRVSLASFDCKRSLA
jgi:hypothetical protein